MRYLRKECEILRSLAKEYIRAARECNRQEKVALYKGVNDLKMKRPAVLIDEVPWSEMNFDGSLNMLCETDYLREIEWYMRKTLYQWRHFPCDMIVTDYIPIYKYVTDSGFGVGAAEKIVRKDAENHVASHEYSDVLKSDEDVAKLVLPVIRHDQTATMDRFNTINEIIGDIIPLKIVGHNSYIANWDIIAQLRGVTPIYLDLFDRPGHSHKIIEMFTRIAISKIDQFEEENLFEPYPLTTHCAAACTDDLPGDDFDESRVLAKNCWGRGMAQCFGDVSKSMHEEFEIEYAKRTLGRFGLVYYGCCEPLHNKIDVIEQIPNLRKISITPWADIETAAETAGGRYALSVKPNPAALVDFDEYAVKTEINKIINACTKYGVNFELVLKDISSVGYNPQNLFRWEKAVMSLV